MTDTILELKGITLSFGGLAVLSDVSFKVPKGMIEVEEEMTVFHCGLTISDCRFAKKPEIFNSQ